MDKYKNKTISISWKILHVFEFAIKIYSTFGSNGIQNKLLQRTLDYISY